MEKRVWWRKMRWKGVKRIEMLKGEFGRRRVIE